MNKAYKSIGLGIAGLAALAGAGLFSPQALAQDANPNYLRLGSQRFQVGVNTDGEVENYREYFKYLWDKVAVK